MPKMSTVQQLPKEIQELIGELREQGHTLDQICAHLATLDAEVSRSALGRHMQKIDKVGEKIRRAREIAEATVRHLGKESESKLARMNIEMIHSGLMDIAAKLEEDSTESNPMSIMLIAKAAQALASAAKADAETTRANLNIDKDKIATEVFSLVIDSLLVGGEKQAAELIGSELETLRAKLKRKWKTLK